MNLKYSYVQQTGKKIHLFSDNVLINGIGAFCVREKDSVPDAGESDADGEPFREHFFREC